MFLFALFVSCVSACVARGEEADSARAKVAAFNLFNHFDPLDVRNNIASARFGGLFNSSWREYRGKFVLEF